MAKEKGNHHKQEEPCYKTLQALGRWGVGEGRREEAKGRGREGIRQVVMVLNILYTQLQSNQLYQLQLTCKIQIPNCFTNCFTP